MKNKHLRLLLLCLCLVSFVSITGAQVYKFIKNPIIIENPENQFSEIKSEPTEPEPSETEVPTESEIPSESESTEPEPSETEVPTESESEPPGPADLLALSDTARKTSQIVTVIAENTIATVTLWEKSDTGWNPTFCVEGYVGSAGIGPADEYHSYTPEGSYTLGFAFGKSNPGTSLEFREITERSYWISNVEDPDYNTWQERDHSASVDEYLIDSVDGAYKYGVVIDYNTACVPGGGSAFFLHCDIGKPTAGCVTISEESMVQLLRQLKPGAYIINVKSIGDFVNY